MTTLLWHLEASRKKLLQKEADATAFKKEFKKKNSVTGTNSTTPHNSIFLLKNDKCYS
jgi:hypothetical protein